jgi:APA family basic amino acid/polyamine antiporter
MKAASAGRGAFVRKSIEALQTDAGNAGLKRTLGPVNLVLLGIGCILGAGIYVMPGNAAANYAGPAVMLSFVISGIACALTALCYAELASTIPASGSSYSYCYAALGEGFAWGLGWLLLLEYGLAASALAVGFSSYFTSLVHDFGIHIPASLASAAVQTTADANHALVFVSGSANALAAAAIVAVTAVLVVGVSESAFVNSILVAVKLAVLVAFISVGLGAIEPRHWTPFIPPSEGAFRFGAAGVMRAASVVFFAYIGFETVSTAAAETRNPQRDLPIGILGSLAICTVVYILVAAILTGVVPYTELGVADPIAVAVDRMGHPRFAVLVKIGALMGLSSVLLVNAYGQSRIGFAMARDGLLPARFSALHARFRTPFWATIIFGAISALGAALFPISLLGDLVSLGAALAFSIVCLSTMWLRVIRPDLPRPFRVPLGGFWIKGVWIGYVPLAGIFMCWAMMLPVVLDVIHQAATGHWLPAEILLGYWLLGVVVYLRFGRHHSLLRLEQSLA